jgi:hypothetical protein
MKIEPTALNRAAARECYQMYIAFVDEGFTPEQAMDLVKTFVVANNAKAND